MRTIFITGGAGFIGSNFFRYMFNKYPNYHFIIIDALTYAGNPENIPKEMMNDDRLEFWYGDVCNGELVCSLVEKSDIVVHFAAESHVARSIFDNRIFFKTDIIGTQTVATAVVKNTRIERFIHISTSEVYGTALTKPMTEDHPLNPMSPYASAKAGADRLVYSYWKTYDIPAIILRPFNQYGPHQHLEKVIPRFITSALLNEPLTVHGDGEAKRDWLYVEDLCKRIDLAVHVDLQKVKGQVINLGSGFDLKILSIARMILEIMKKPESLISFIGDRPGQVQHHISSTDKAEKFLGIEPGRSFEEGLELTIKWYSDNRAWWEKLLWMRKVPIVSKIGKVEYY